MPARGKGVDESEETISDGAHQVPVKSRDVSAGVGHKRG